MKRMLLQYGQWLILAIVGLLMVVVYGQAEVVSARSDSGLSEGQGFGNGAPFYPGDEKWQAGLADPSHALRSFSGAEVRQMMALGNQLFIGGSFSHAGLAEARDAAFWDGSTWHSFGEGLNGQINQKVVFGNNLVVARTFTQAGGQIVNAIARWDGSAWHDMAGEMNGPAWSLVVIGGDLYAGGSFTQINGQPANHLARWDGSAWHDLGAGRAEVPVHMLAVGSALYVVDVANTGNGLLNTLSRWNGSAWQTLNSTLQGQIYRVRAVGDELYVHGYFEFPPQAPNDHLLWWNGSAWQAIDENLPGFAGSVDFMGAVGGQLYISFPYYNQYTAIKVARWDGSSWHSLEGFFRDSITDLGMAGGSLYAAGNFIGIDSAPTSYLARWNGAAWAVVGGGLSGSASDLVVVGDALYVAGAFERAGGQMVNGIARWENGAWHGLGDGVSYPATVTSFAMQGSSLVAGGSFTHLGSQPLNRVARWDGNTWQPLGDGIDGTLLTLSASQDAVCAGGYLHAAGGQPASGVACWNGSTWDTLAGGVTWPTYSGSITSLLFWNGDLYAAGTFSLAGGQPANSVARWDGSAWSDVGGGVTDGADSGSVSAMAVFDGSLYVAGIFTSAGGQPASGFARWDGSAWHDLGSTLSGINELAVYDGQLYAGGRFMLPSSGVARWDGGAWQPVGSGLALKGWNGVVNLFAAADGLYAAGGFSQMTGDGYPAHGIAFWNGNEWQRLGSGLTAVDWFGNRYAAESMAVAAIGDQVFVGGSFEVAGNQRSPGFAIWHTRPELRTRYNSGAPGSTFTLSGQYFKANTAYTVQIGGSSGAGAAALSASDGTPMTGYSLMSDGQGRLVFNLLTRSGDRPGNYQVQVVGEGETARLDVQLDTSAPTRQPEGGAPLVGLDGRPVYQMFVPAVMKR